ncbi:hypothetical protein KFK09_012535 [Dendrobium nobile]|uniref:Uncharacterized protein n=1 Tax=Dendrobium nobile TaxID=94219 RepID=A0A8T3BJ72_DENNO|nr:hypothetical protein KFK09_012535 [Dendrobium nobile]
MLPSRRLCIALFDSALGLSCSRLHASEAISWVRKFMAVISSLLIATCALHIATLGFRSH